MLSSQTSVTTNKTTVLSKGEPSLESLRASFRWLDPEAKKNVARLLLGLTASTGALGHTQAASVTYDNSTTPIISQVEMSDFSPITIESNERYISFSEAVREQREIFARLLKEIDDGLEAEAKHWNYYQDRDNEE